MKSKENIKSHELIQPKFIDQAKEKKERSLFMKSLKRNLLAKRTSAKIKPRTAALEKTQKK